MGNEDQLPGAGALDFFRDPDAVKWFARLDFQLKDGVHFQDHEQQRPLFQFIRKHERSLKLFYAQYYEVRLAHGGEGPDRYYYLDFVPNNRGKIDGDHREFLKNEHVIMGFLLYKIMFIDRQVDLSSVRQLQAVVRNDYEELRPDLYRLLAKVKKTNPTAWGDQKLDELVAEALADFKRLGWVVLDGDLFDVLPAFQRLHQLYGDYINRVEEWIKKYGDEKIS